MGSANKVADGVVWSIINKLLNGIYGFISVPLLINYFGKAEYGLIGLAMSINVYMRLMDLGFNSTNLRFYSAWFAKGNNGKIRKLFQTSLAFYGSIGLINAAILIIVSFFTPQLFHLTLEQDGILKTLIYILAFSAVISWFSSCFDQLIRASENVGWIQRCSILPTVVQILVLFATIYGKLSIATYYLLSVLCNFIIIPIYIKKIKQLAPYVNFLPCFDWPTLKEMLPYALGIFSFSIFSFTFYNLRPVFLGMQGTVESVADFRILNGIVGFITTFSSVFMGALLPSSARIVAQGNQEAYYRIAYDGTKYISIVLCLCVFGVMTVGKELLSIYVGDSFLYLVPWLNLWLICILGTHNQAMSSLILSGTDVRAISYSTAAASVLGLIASWFLIPYYQIGGVVIAFVIYMGIQMVFYYFYYWPRIMKINSWRVFYYSIGPYIALGVSLYFLINSFMDYNLGYWSLFFIKGCTFGIAYLIVTVLLITKSDKEYLESLIRFKKRG